jgi:hypothetical protein
MTMEAGGFFSVEDPPDLFGDPGQPFEDCHDPYAQLPAVSPTPPLSQQLVMVGSCAGKDYGVTEVGRLVQVRGAGPQAIGRYCEAVMVSNDLADFQQPLELRPSYFELRSCSVFIDSEPFLLYDLGLLWKQIATDPPDCWPVWREMFAAAAYHHRRGSELLQNFRSGEDALLSVHLGQLIRLGEKSCLTKLWDAAQSTWTSLEDTAWTFDLGPRLGGFRLRWPWSTRAVEDFKLRAILSPGADTLRRVTIEREAITVQDIQVLPGYASRPGDNQRPGSGTATGSLDDGPQPPPWLSAISQAREPVAEAQRQLAACPTAEADICVHMAYLLSEAPLPEVEPWLERAVGLLRWRTALGLQVCRLWLDIDPGNARALELQKGLNASYLSPEGPLSNPSES